MKKVNFLLVPILGVLFSCGGGDENNGADKLVKYNITGHVTDIIGAEVFLDLNQNGKLDAKEPFDISGENGLYSFDVAENMAQCIGVTPIVANVDGLKEGTSFVSGEPIDGSFTLYRPPSYYINAKVNNSFNYDIDVVTTMSWAPVPLLVNLDGTMASCKTINTNDYYAYADQQKVFFLEKEKNQDIYKNLDDNDINALLQIYIQIASKKNNQNEYHKISYALAPNGEIDIYTPSTYDILKFDFEVTVNGIKKYKENISKVNGTNLGAFLYYKNVYKKEKSFFDFHEYNPENDIDKTNAFPSLFIVGNTQTKIHDFNSNTCTMKESLVFLDSVDRFSRSKEVENIIYKNNDSCSNFYKGVFFDKATITEAHATMDSIYDTEKNNGVVVFKSTKQYTAIKSNDDFLYDYSVYFDFKNGFENGLTDGGLYNINNLYNLSVKASTATQSTCMSADYNSGFLNATTYYTSLSVDRATPYIQEESYEYTFETLNPDTTPTGVCYTNTTVLSNSIIDQYSHVEENKNASPIYENKK